MTGIVKVSNQWRYYESNTAAPTAVTSGQSLSNDIIYVTSAGNRASTTNNALELYPLCEVDKSLCECEAFRRKVAGRNSCFVFVSDDGTQHVVMRVPTGSSNLQMSMYSWWTGSHMTPNLDAQFTSNLFSLEVDVADIYKSPIIDCAWSYVKEVRLSFYKDDVEVAFLNFEPPSSSTKSNFFSHANLRGSTWTDMKAYTPSACSLAG